MKKVVLLILAAALAIGSVVSSSAAMCGFDAADGVIGQSFLSNELGSDTNEIRNTWTNSRGLDNSGATFVNVGSEEDVNPAVEVTGSAFAIADAGSSNNLKAYVDIKYVDDAEFCGMVLDCTDEGYGSGTTEFSCAHTGFVLTSGYGFTLRADNKIELFVNASATGTVDAATFDLADFGVDSSEFVTYVIYRTTDGKAYVSADNVLVGIIDFSGSNCCILNADGSASTAANGNPADTNNNYNTAGVPFFAVVGDGDTDVFFDNIGYDEFSALPTFDLKAGLVDYSLANGIGGVGTNWIQGAVGTYQAVAVDLLSDFYGFSFPILWASNPANGQNAIDIKYEVFAFDTDLETSFAGTALYTTTRTYNCDQSNGDSITFDEALKAGKYVIKISTLTANGADGKAAYLVLPTNDDLKYDGFHYIYSGTPFNITLKLDEAKEYLGVIGDSETIAITGKSDENGGNAHQLTGHGPLAIVLNIEEGYTLKALVGHCPTWGDAGSGIVATVYAWNTDYDTSVAGNVLATATIDNYSEAAQWATLTFDNELPAGDYLILFTAANAHHVGFWNATSNSGAITKVFKTNGEAMVENSTFVPVLKVVRGLASEDEPGTDVPQTGDNSIAMFAAVVVIALAAVVVLKKKVNA